MVVAKKSNNQQEESIYNLIPRNEIRSASTSGYQSRFKPNILQALKEVKYEHRTMGYAEESQPDPQQFLKKHHRDTRPGAPKGRSSSADRLPHKPRVPTIREMPKSAEKTKKNFLLSNALDIIMTVPKRPERILVDTQNGDKFPLDSSGLVPKYVHKKDFGEVPLYIKTRREDIEKAKQEYQTYVSDYFRHGAMRVMPDEERQSLIDALKKQWEDIHNKYQKLPVIIETVSTRNYRDDLNRQMKLIEKDIDLLQKHKIIYITD